MGTTTNDFVKQISTAFDRQLDVRPEAIKQQEILDQFETVGLPVRKDELYKYTPIERILKQHIELDTVTFNAEWSGDKLSSHFYPEEGNHLVFVNGRYQETFSKVKDNVELVPATEVKKEGFDLLNRTFSPEELKVSASMNTEPLPYFIYQFIDSSEGAIFANPRVFIQAEKGARIDLIEKVITHGSEPVFLNTVYRTDVAQSASVNITKVQHLPMHVVAVDTLTADQARDSKLYTNTYSLSGRIIRNNLNIAINDENCESHLSGLYLLTGQSHVDNNTEVDHRMPRSYSNERYKGIVDENAVGIFNGRIYVRPDAQQTNAFQSNQNICLSETAKIHAKPQLEIWADDVKCSHGCTVGQLDEEAIFYLRTRGLSKRVAQAMLLMAFAEETLTHVPIESVQTELTEMIENRLS